MIHELGELAAACGPFQVGPRVAANVTEGLPGVRRENPIKVFGPNLDELEQTAMKIRDVLNAVEGVQNAGAFRIRGQSNLEFPGDRQERSEWGVTAADLPMAIHSAVGGKAVTQVKEGADLRPHRTLAAATEGRRSEHSRHPGAGLEHRHRRQPVQLRCAIAEHTDPASGRPRDEERLDGPTRFQRVIPSTGRFDDLPRAGPAFQRHQVRGARPRTRGQRGRGEIEDRPDGGDAVPGRVGRVQTKWKRSRTEWPGCSRFRWCPSPSCSTFPFGARCDRRLRKRLGNDCRWRLGAVSTSELPLTRPHFG